MSPTEGPSMLLTVRATSAYELSAETFLCLMVEPPLKGPSHRVLEEKLLTTTTVFCDLRSDLYGNPRRHVIAPEGRFSFEFKATVEIAPNVALPPDAVEHRPEAIPGEAMVIRCPRGFASRTCSRGWRSMSSATFLTAESGSWRSPSGSASTSSTAMGRPTR